MLKKIDFKILGTKEILISLSVILAIFLLFILGGRFSYISDILLFIDVVLPIILAVPSIVIFHFHLSSEMTNILKVYGNKSYNKYILKLILQYLLAITIIFILFSFIAFFMYSTNGITFEWKGIDFREINIINILCKSYINLLFLTVVTMFILKISKNLIFTFFTIGLYTFQEIAGDGSYTEPVNLFITYEQRSMYTPEIILMNRCFFIISTVGMLYYVVKKNN